MEHNRQRKTLTVVDPDVTLSQIVHEFLSDQCKKRAETLKARLALFSPEQRREDKQLRYDECMIHVLSHIASVGIRELNHSLQEQ